MSNRYADAYSNNEDFDGDPPKTFEQFLQLSQMASFEVTVVTCLAAAVCHWANLPNRYSALC